MSVDAGLVRILTQDDDRYEAVRAILATNGFRTDVVHPNGMHPLGSSLPSCLLVGLDIDLSSEGAKRILASYKVAGWHFMIEAIAGPTSADRLTQASSILGGFEGAVICPVYPLAPVESDILSIREVEVMQLVAEGMTNKQIGEVLGLSALTIKSHLMRTFRKLHAKDRSHATLLVMREGLIN